MRVLVPLDGSRLGDAIVAHVRRLATREGEPVEVTLLTTIEAWESEQQQATRRQELLAHHQELLDLLRAEGVPALSQVMVATDPAQQIVESALTHKADLIAMSSHGRSGLQRWRRGSVAERVLRAATVPVYVANPRGVVQVRDEVRWNRILVPLDGSTRAEKVLPLAGSFAGACGAELVLLHVDRPGQGGVHPVPEVAQRHAQEHAEKTLEHCRHPLTQAGLTVRVVGRYGPDPAHEVLEAAREVQADLLALASHGRTGLARWRFGSVAERLIQTAECPLLVVRAAD